MNCEIRYTFRAAEINSQRNGRNRTAIRAATRHSGRRGTPRGEILLVLATHKSRRALMFGNSGADLLFDVAKDAFRTGQYPLRREQKRQQRSGLAILTSPAIH